VTGPEHPPVTAPRSPTSHRAPIEVVYFQRRPRRNANFSIEFVFDTLRRELGDHINAKICIAPSTSNGLLRRLGIVWHARRHQGQINHVTGDTNFTGLLLDPARTILTNHDCGYLRRTHGVRRWLLKKFWLDWPVKHAAAVTTVSSQIKAEIVKYTGCSPSKVHVIPNAAPACFAYHPKEGMSPRPRILHIGTAPNKNLPRLIEALSGLPCVLIIVGDVDRTVVEQLQEARVDVERYANVPAAKMMQLYRESDIVAFTSLYEGFGLPILEAQAIGRPLVTSNRQPMNEIAGPGACLVDPESVAEIRAAIERFMADADYRKSVVASGRANVDRFRPAAIAQQYLKLYEQVFEAVNVRESS
jgi:glycosyltransferase involved in cell wall biosynthesis